MNNYQKIKYLDPKNDLTFRKIFGEHPHLLISFLNCMLPLQENQLIEHIDYQDNEIIPELPGFKRSLVDVRCTDNWGRQFIVEMQMYWTSSFKKRMLFNAGKAYVKQLRGGGKYTDLKPVYGLSLIDDNFMTDTKFENIYYHHYNFVHTLDHSEHIEGLELIFVELPKFKVQNLSEKRLRNLWLRFLTEIDENTENVSDDLKNDKLINEALEYVQKDAFSLEELLYYEKYWDSIRTEKAALEEALEKNKQLHIENEKAKQGEQEAKQHAEEAKLREEEAKQREEKAKQHAEEAKLREEEAKQREEEAKQREEEAKQTAKNIAVKLAAKMKKYGEPIHAIIEETGLLAHEIEIL